MKTPSTNESVVSNETESIPRGSETILVVEDELTVRNFIAEILTACGYKVLSVSHGYDAVDKAKKETVDLLLADVMMKWKNGVQTAQEIRDLHPKMKILFISGYTEEELAHTAMEAGTASFLSKPFTPKAIALKVREVLDR